MNVSALIKKYDTQNQFQVLIDSCKQIENAWENKFELDPLLERELNNIIICGMGGSAISADLLKCFLGEELQLPLFVNRDYSLPAFANKRTLVIISSYSGNTEETISCFKEAVEKKCNVAAVSTGGRIKDYAIEKKIPRINLEEGYQPRFALGASFSTLLKILQSINLIPNQNGVIGNIVSLWKTKGIEYSKEKNSALRIAEDLIGFIPIIYSSVSFEPVAYR